jgi:hypothetical protein
MLAGRFPSRTIAVILLALTCGVASSQEGEQARDDEGPEGIGIRDNSFLIEEAFNQEQGVVQHIFNWIPSWDRQGPFRRSDFDFVFTQEWPIFGQKHQFSYTLPMLYTSERLNGGSAVEAQGFGDIFLNYRYQALGGPEGEFAFAPRFSVILPTGEESTGLGHDTTGFQVNLPFSKEFERWVFHFNAGASWLPDAEAGVEPDIPFDGNTLNGYLLGGSVIRALNPRFHLMLESVAVWDEENTFRGDEDKSFELLLSPGFRWAPYTEGDTQWVVGMGVPIGLSRDAPDVSLFLYMSFEHRIAKKREGDRSDDTALRSEGSGLFRGR